MLESRNIIEYEFVAKTQAPCNVSSVKRGKTRQNTRVFSVFSLKLVTILKTAGNNTMKAPQVLGFAVIV